MPIAPEPPLSRPSGRGAGGEGPPQRMRFVLCTCPGLIAPRVLAGLLRSPRLELAGVVCSSRILSARYGSARGAWEQVQRSGLAYSAYLWLATSGADWVQRARCAAHPSVAGMARARSVPLLTTRDVNGASGRRFVEGCRPDLIVSAFFNQRLGEGLLDLPPLGCVNIHPSMLPDFKGVDPVFFSRLEGAALGVTVHRMTAALDAGAVLARAPVAVAHGASVAMASAELFAAGAALLVEQLDAIERGWAGEAQHGAGRYDSWPDPAQVRAMRSKSGALVRVADLFV